MMQVRSISYVAAALLVAAALPAHAKEPRTAPGSIETKLADASSPAAAAEKKICKKLVRSGTRFRETACLTKSQWQKVEAEAKS